MAPYFIKLTNLLRRGGFYHFNCFYLSFILLTTTCLWKTTNEMMRATHGNIKQLSIFAKNIPAITLSPKDQVTTVETVLARMKCDILIISEMNSKLVAASRFPGYVCHPGYLGGDGDLVRVSALVRTGLAHTATHIECEVPNIVLEFKVDGKQHRVTGVYREWNYSARPSGKQEQLDRWCEFEDRWYDANKRCRNSVLLGDINYCYFGGGSSHQATMENIRISVRENVVMRGWKQMITKNTRFNKDQVPSCLDHIYTNNPSVVKYVVNRPFSEGDHNLTGIVLRTGKPPLKPETITTRLMDRANWPWARYMIRYSSRLFKIFRLRDPDDIVDAIEVELMTVLDAVAPEIELTIRPDSPRWMTSAILDSIEYRDALKAKYEETGDNTVWAKWQEVKRDTRRRIRDSKEKTILEDLEVKDPKRRWQRIKSLSGGAEAGGPPVELLEGGERVKDQEQMADILNTGFRTKVNKILSEVKSDSTEAMRLFEEFAQSREKLNQNGKFSGFRFKEVDHSDIELAISSLKNTGALGCDKIPTRLLKEVKRELSPYLCYLCNTIIRTSKYPRRWVRGLITPLWKGKGPRDLKANMRPVTILTSMSKVFSRLANDQLVNYLRLNRIQPPNLYAYTKYRGVDDYWIDLTSKFAEAKDGGYKMALSMYDLSSAFDLCQQSILIPKLKRLGLEDSATDLISSLLTDRVVRTKIGDKLSREETFSVGSPQGEILSSSLFTILVLDFGTVKSRLETKARNEGISYSELNTETGEKVVNTMVIPDLKVDSQEYADDAGITIVTKTESQLRHAVQAADQDIIHYYTVNGLAPNRSKTECLSICNRFATPIQCGEVQSQKEIKLLGVKMTNKLSFMPHALSLVGKVADKLPMIRRLRDWAPLILVKRTTEALILSHIYFALHIYAGGEKRVITILQKMMNRVMRCVLGLEKIPIHETSVAEMLETLGWDNIPRMLTWRTIFWFRRVERGGGSGPYTSSILHRSQAVYETRKKILSVQFIPQTLPTEGCFIHRALKLYEDYNLLPRLFLNKEEMAEVVMSEIRDKIPNINVS